MKNKKLVGIIGVLILLNGLLLYFNMDLQNKIGNIDKESKSWAFEQVGESTAQLTHPEVKKPDSGLVFMVFLTDEGCISCVENEIRNLNEFHKNFNSSLQVYILAADTSYLKQFYINFPVESINSEAVVLDREFDFINPVALVVDSNGMVQNIEMSEVGNPGKRNRFYKRMTSLFNSIE